MPPRSGAYLVDEFLDHGLREFGGYDSLVLWHAYPRIGVDERNQFGLLLRHAGWVKGAAVHRRGHPTTRRESVY